MSAVTSSVTSVAPAYMIKPRKWIDAAEGPAGSRADCGPVHPDSSTKDASSGSLGSRRIGLLHRIKVGSHMPGLLGREPYVRHASLRQRRRRVLQKCDHDCGFVRQLPGDEAA